MSAQLDIATLIEAIDDYVAQHENDTGGQTFVETNNIVMATMATLSRILADYQNRSNP